MKMDVNGTTYRIIQDTDVHVNRMRVYKEWSEYRDGTWPLKHRRQIDRYADLMSCIACVVSDIKGKEMTIVSAELWEEGLRKPWW